MASALSKPEAQGRAVGIVMGGMLIGILLARTVAGFRRHLFGWRGTYAVAGRDDGRFAVPRAVLLWSAVPARESAIGSCFRD